MPPFSFPMRSLASPSPIAAIAPRDLRPRFTAGYHHAVLLLLQHWWLVRGRPIRLSKGRFPLKHYYVWTGYSTEKAVSRIGQFSRFRFYPTAPWAAHRVKDYRPELPELGRGVRGANRTAGISCTTVRKGRPSGCGIVGCYRGGAANWSNRPKSSSTVSVAEHSLSRQQVILPSADCRRSTSRSGIHPRTVSFSLWQRSKLEKGH